MFPEPEYSPAGGHEGIVLLNIPFDIPQQLRGPVPGVGGRPTSMDWARVPEAPVYEDRQAMFCEGDIGTDQHAVNAYWVVLSEPEPAPMKCRDRAFACFSSGWSDSPFAGSLRFRVATGQPLPISVTDGCLLSYREQTRRQLLLPANLSVLAAARNVMIACGQDAARWSFANIANACRADSSLAAAFDEGMSYMAMATVADRQLEDREDIMRQVESSSPGIEVFREALLKTNRSALRRSGRDIVHALVHRGGRGYISSRGTNLYFFEIGQDLLLLLAKVIVGDTHMPFRRFLEELRRYGFAPQNRTEEDRLADTLRVLNLLEKHSDAGEAMYVKHFL